MTANEKYKFLVSRLVPLYGEAEARSIASLLFEMRYSISRMQRLLDPLIEFPASLEEHFISDIASLERWVPVQYIIGRAEFMGRDFEVSPDVLIPRGETEELVARMVDRYASADKLRIADIGTGSGAIAVSLALELPRSRVTAYDISEAALVLAGSNARRLGAEVRFERQDALAVESFSQLIDADVIVSNPPYVCPSEKESMRDNVTLHEPALALYVPENDPLLFYRALVTLPAREMWFEINERFADGVCALLCEGGFRDVKSIKDIHGRDRMVCAFDRKQ